MTVPQVTLAPEAIDALAAAIANRRAKLLYSPEEAAEALGMSRDHFDKHVKPELRIVRVGQLVRVPVAELERYVGEHAARVFE